MVCENGSLGAAGWWLWLSVSTQVKSGLWSEHVLPGPHTRLLAALGSSPALAGGLSSLWCGSLQHSSWLPPAPAIQHRETDRKKLQPNLRNGFPPRLPLAHSGVEIRLGAPWKSTDAEARPLLCRSCSPWFLVQPCGLLILSEPSLVIKEMSVCT